MTKVLAVLAAIIGTAILQAAGIIHILDGYVPFVLNLLNK